MDVLPLAADSMGVRSMATLVDTGNVRVLIDPGVTLAETRRGVPPTAQERQAYEEAVSRIVGTLCQVDAVVVTRYHEEHISLLPYVLSSTAVYLKTPVGPLERRYAQDLFPRLRRTGRAFELVDNSSVGWRDVELTFSPALPEGRGGTGQGPVMAVAVQSGGRCFVHGSDVQGPLSPLAVAWFLRQSPDVLLLSGLPTYRIWWHADSACERPAPADVRLARDHLLTLMNYTRAHIILDHYLCREGSYRRWFPEVYDTGRVCSAAEYAGRPERLLEAERSPQIAAPPGAAPSPRRAELSGHALKSRSRESTPMLASVS